MTITARSSLLLLLFSFLTLNTLAAQNDSIKPKRDSTRVQYFTGNFEKFGILKTITIDTIVTGFQNYNPLYKKQPFYSTLGNIGQASQPLLPFSYGTSSGFDYGKHVFDPFLYQNDSVRYYKVYKTYTDLEYVQGAKKELFFHAIFSRNLYRSLNLGFDFRVLSSAGFYSRQKTNHINFVLTTQYFTPNRRYALVANLRLNLLKNQENGGIKYDSVFEQNLESNREIIPVNLSQAQDRIKDNGFFIKQYFNLSKHYSATDSTANKKKRPELGRISYSFEYNRQVFHYQDYNPKDNFYKDFFLDTITTSDSININRYRSVLSWTNPNFKPDKKNRLLQLEFSLRHEYAEIYNYGKKAFINQFIPFSEISFNPYAGFTLKGYADYVTGDYNGGDFSVRASITQVLGGIKRNAGSISLNGYYALQKPAWFMEYYSGNNFRWDTAWNQQGIISGGFIYSLKNWFETGFQISRISNFVYLDTAVSPQQFKPEFGLMRVFMKADIPVGKFTFRGNFVYQTVQGTNVLRLPAFMGNLNIYFTQPLFHGAALLQPGFQFNYNSLYYGNSYMPAVQAFYLQDQKQIGDYTYMDVFVNLKVQRARIFFMYSHLNSGFMAYRYYTVPHYPMPDGSFKFGVTWRFHD